MIKSDKVPCLERAELNEESALKIFYSGAVTIFITENGILLGCITNGDISRNINKGNISYLEYINRNGKSISFQNEAAAVREATQIFEQYPFIDNIPVVDGDGRLLFQYERENSRINKRIYNKILWYSRDCLGNFFSWYGDRKYILCVLDAKRDRIFGMAESLFQEKLCQLGIEQNFVCCDCYTIPPLTGEEVIICWNSVIKDYLQRKITTQCEKICLITIDEMDMYLTPREIDKLLLIDFNIVRNWVELFGYQRICFQIYNKYTKHLGKLLEIVGIETHYSLSDAENSLCYAVVCYSSNSEYRDYYIYSDFFNTLWELNCFNDINKRSLNREHFATEFLLYLKALFKETLFKRKKGAIYRHSFYNELDVELYCTLLEDDDIREKITITSLGKIEQSIVICSYRNSEWNSNQYRVNFRVSCIGRLTDKSILRKIQKYCKNVFIHYYDASKVHLDWEISALTYRKGFFPINKIKFKKDMYGDANIDLSYRIDKADELAQPQVINPNYVKNRSHIDDFFRTDYKGNWIIEGRIKSDKHIYMVGGCSYTGQYDDSSKNIPSFLQHRLVEEGFSYEVENLSVWGGRLYDLYGKLLEKKWNTNDVVIISPRTYVGITDTNGDEYSILTNWDEIDTMVQEKYWYWGDAFAHCNYHVFEIIANQIFDKIKPKLVAENTEPEFHVVDDMEKEIKSYLNKCQMILNDVLDDKKVVKNRNCGAIVMNCNPFTLGHQYLIETAARLVDFLYIFVVEEDKSYFSFGDRLAMVQQGTQHLDNVAVLPGGKFMISSITFPGYFTKERLEQDADDSFLDLKIFAYYIAPAFDISIRFVGREPFDKVTAQYNEDMKAILSEQDIMVLEIPRKTTGNDIISATVVRKLFKEKDWNRLRQFVPETTFSFLKVMDIES